MALNFASLPLETKQLHVPNMKNLQCILERGLKSDYSHVSVEIQTCPDLKCEPFNLSASGICGNAKIVQIGGTQFMFPMPRREKLYELRKMPNILNMNPAFILGAAAGPFPFLGRNNEGCYDMFLDNNSIVQNSSFSYVNANGKLEYRKAPVNESRCAIMGNFFLSNGATDKVIKISVRNRIGLYDFPASIRHAIAQGYKDTIIGLGGAFFMKSGSFQHHVMPDFSTTPLMSSKEVIEWLQYYQFEAPLVAYGYLLAGNVPDYYKRQHFHSVSKSKTNPECGHYIIDTTPENVEYCGYFNVASSLMIFDKPPATSKTVIDEDYYDTDKD